MRVIMLSLAVLLPQLSLGCRKNAPPGASKEPAAEVKPAGGAGEETVPRVEPEPGAPKAPVETAPPNVPEFEPAFAGQTRAPLIETQTPLEVTTIAEDFDKPWAIEFLPDGHMLVTEKHDGELHVVTPTGGKSPPVAGVPEVDGGDREACSTSRSTPTTAKASSSTSVTTSHVRMVTVWQWRALG